MKLQTIFIAALLTAANAVTAQADGIPIVPLPPPVEVYSYPRHIYRDGNYFFCPSADYDPYCRMPNDYSWAQVGPPWRHHPPVISQPVPMTMAPHRPFAETVTPPTANQPQEPMDDSRERVIQMGEEHCRRFRHDSICHPPR